MLTSPSPIRRPKTSWRSCATSTRSAFTRPEDRAMTSFSNTFGLAMRNFTTFPEMPDPQALIAYALKAEELGFDSVWVWDHIFLGVDPPFPVIDSLTLLSAVAASTARVQLGTGVLV